MRSSWVFFSTCTSCLKCESRSPIPFPEIWIRLSGSFCLLDLCSACFLVPTQRAGDLWLGRKCFSKQCCPAILRAWCSKPASFFKHRERFMVGERGHIGLHPYGNSKVAGTLGKGADFWPTGAMTRAKIQDSERTMWTLRPQSTSYPPGRRFPFKKDVSLSHPLQSALCHKALFSVGMGSAAFSSHRAEWESIRS